MKVRLRRPLLFITAVLMWFGTGIAMLHAQKKESPKIPGYEIPLTEVREIDGSNSGTGGYTGVQLLRYAPADYPGDGSGGEIKEWPSWPNPRTVSNTVASQSQGVPNSAYLSDMIWAWGQFLDHDIDLTDSHSSNGTADIPIENPADQLGPLPILFSRSNYDPTTGAAGVPRQQINEITAFIDASNVYGSDPIRAASLRTFEDGLLKTSGRGDLLPLNVDGLPNAGGESAELFLAGDVRANEQVGLTAMHTLFVREHNRLARLIAKHFTEKGNEQSSPAERDEQIYQLARKLVGAEMQVITYNEFLPALLGPLAPNLSDYTGWNPNIDAGIANEFSTAAYRVGHTMLSPTLVLADKQGPYGELPLRNAFFNPGFIQSDPEHVDHLLHGFSLQLAQEIDNYVVDDIRNFLFGPPGAGGLDLASLNIQRGRDHGLSGYNDTRVALGLSPASSFADISSDPAVQSALSSVYASPEDVDLWIGGLCEDHLPGAHVGELFGTILIDQFTRLRDGDRFFFLNDPDLGDPRLQQVLSLENFGLADVIRWNTKIKHIRSEVFYLY